MAAGIPSMTFFSVSYQTRLAKTHTLAPSRVVPYRPYRAMQLRGILTIK